ncbi:hypothetical protein [Apilactobacillus xinyiensis]|uniref:hypothetical protein n=1 Tax=Apilactobacillus xinyiensis TaxID=2841032 RepID=UPI00200DD829|nr:hypothetical protein [Apilactobacillus xinyiensis]MCL0330617.1 hypothetical protein [Apilactobacillus xinyiensis]
MIHVGVYITNHRNKTVELPVAPAEFLVKQTTDDKKVEVVKLGEIDRIGAEKLIELSLSALIPLKPKESHYVTAKNFLSSGSQYIKFFKQIHKDRKPCRIVLTGGNITLSATLNEFEYGFKDGFPEEFNCTFTFTQYKSYKARKLKYSKKHKKALKKGKRRKKPAHKKSRGSKAKLNGKIKTTKLGKTKKVSYNNVNATVGSVRYQKVKHKDGTYHKYRQFQMKREPNLQKEYFFRKSSQPHYKHPIKVPTGSIGFINEGNIFKKPPQTKQDTRKQTFESSMKAIRNMKMPKNNSVSSIEKKAKLPNMSGNLFGG